MTPRSVVLGVALAATLAASWWAIRTDDAPVAVSTREAAAPRGRTDIRAPGPAAPPVSADALRLQREPWPAWAANLFDPLPVSRPVASMPAPSAQPASGAPPLSFRYVGEIQDGAGRAVILTEGDEVHIVRVRQRIGDRYRVERISANEVEFTYLPLMQRQVLVTSNHEQYN